MKKQAIWIVLLLLSIMLTACKTETPLSEQKTLTFVSELVSLYPNETIQLEWRAPENVNVEFSSSNTDVLTIDQNGRITGVANGSATVIASIGEYDKAYLPVTVLKDVLISEININIGTEQVVLLCGTEYNIPATVQKAGTSVADAQIAWASSNEAVATVNDGKVVAIAPGSAEITASVSVDGKTVSRYCDVTVYEHFRIELDQEKIEAPIGKEFSLEAKIYSSNGDIVTPADGELEFITSNPSAVAIQDGGFKVISIGTASAGVRYKGNVATIPVEIFSVKASFFKDSTTDFYGEIGGETFSGVVINSTSYQPHFYFNESGMQQIQEYAQEKGYTTLRMHTYAILKNNNFRINGRHVNRERWITSEVPISEINESFWFWSESEGSTEVYIWFEFC